VFLIRVVLIDVIRTQTERERERAHKRLAQLLNPISSVPKQLFSITHVKWKHRESRLKVNIPLTTTTHEEDR